MIDIIGDLHGHADKLEALLKKLNYTLSNGHYSHPDNRKALFVGDYIDRGPKIRETLDIIRNMVDSGNAIALMGNHEYNALCFHFQKTDGGHLRQHSIKNIIQHKETLFQFHNKQKEYDEYIDWFKTLPLYFENEQIRAIHACWDIENIDYLRNTLINDRLTDDLIFQSAINGSSLYNVIDESLKGKEIKMPSGLNFKDKDGSIRTEIRIKWWENPVKSTYKKLSVLPIEKLSDTPVDTSILSNLNYYNEDYKPVFFGHYWLNGQPSLYRNNICCLDYSVAKKGYLVAYKHDGEQTLDSNKLIYV